MRDCASLTIDSTRVAEHALRSTVTNFYWNKLIWNKLAHKISSYSSVQFGDVYWALLATHSMTWMSSVLRHKNYYWNRRAHKTSFTSSVIIKSISQFQGLDAGSVTVFIRDYPWESVFGSIDMTVMFLPGSTVMLPRSWFSVAWFSTCSKISFLL